MEVLIVSCIIMAIWFIYDIPRFLKEIEKNPYSDITSANVAASLGVLCTFGGIIYVLWNFDTNNIELSIPNMLDGMKMAFLTSIIGMMVSLILKHLQDRKQRSFEHKNFKDKENISDDAKIADLIQYLQKRDEQNQQFIYDHLKTVTNLISAIEESVSTLINTVNDLKDISNQTKEIAPSIHNLIQTTNDELRNYSEKSLMIVNGYLEGAVNASNDTIIEICNNMTNSVDSSIDSAIVKIAAYSEVTNQTVADLIGKIDSISQMVTNNSLQQQEEVNKAIISTRRLFESATDDAKTLTTSLSTSVKNINRDIESISQTVIATSEQQQEAIQKAAEKLSTSSLEITKRISAEVEAIVKINNDNLLQSSKNISNDLNQKLRDSLQSLGNALAQISNQFARDYIPLAEKLKEVLLIAENIKTGGKR